ncbi:phosphoribosyltransferase-like protein [Streptococcus anginosus]|uniref:phosphoribosyltransferase-like protein n=1 Tax=Streptococcus anginosus TaxID=1328 RepID=UPI00321ADBF2
MVIKNFNKLIQHLQAISLKLKVNKILKKFYARNSISTEEQNSERYLENLHKKLFYFLQQLKDKNEAEIFSLIISILEDHYTYYSANSFQKFYDFTYERVKDRYTSVFADITNCKFAPILNKDPYVYNSSEHMLTLFIDKYYIQNPYVDRYIRELLKLEYNLSKNKNDIAKMEQEILELHTDIKNSSNNKIQIQELIKTSTKKLNDYRSQHQYIKKDIKNAKGKLKNSYKRTDFLVLLDDFSGSGETIIDYLKVLQKYLPKKIQVLIFCLHGMYDAEQTLTDWCVNNKTLNVTIYFFGKEKKFFDKFENLSPNHQSQLEKLKLKLKYFEQTYVLETDEQKYTLGYNDTESLVTNYRNTPNNTFSIFWKKSKNLKWKPLFPRNEKHDSKKHFTFDPTERQFIRKNIYQICKNKYIGDCDIYDKEGVAMIIFLVYVNNNDKKYYKTDDNTIVEDLVKDYNRSVLQDCLKYNLMIDLHGYYELSNLGQETLNNLSLSNASLESLAKDTVFNAEDALPPYSNYRPKISS